MDKAVEPMISEETRKYIKELTMSDTVSPSQLHEYLEHVLIPGKENFASFVAIVDTFLRSDESFRRIVQLHGAALKENDKYKEIYDEASVKGSEMDNLIESRLLWNKNKQEA